jgi:hypothetical protein
MVMLAHDKESVVVDASVLTSAVAPTHDNHRRTQSYRSEKIGSSVSVFKTEGPYLDDFFKTLPPARSARRECAATAKR